MTCHARLLPGLLSAALALSGCAVGPNFHPSAAPPEQSYGPEPAALSTGPQRLVPGAAPGADWWRGMGSPELDRLMATALAHNADLGAARATLREAREVYLAQRGSLLPSVDVQAQAQTAKNSESLAPPLSSNAVRYDLFTGQVNVGYALDVFGGVRRATEAAAAQAEQQRFQSEAAYLALTGNVASAYVQLAVLRDQLGVSEALLAANQRLVELTRLQHDKGQVSGAVLGQADAQLAQARASAAALRKQVAQQLDLLATLCGETPAELGDAPARLSGLRLPATLPLSLPAQMVRQRPDVRAAEAAVHAASAQLGVAIAARLPAISISASAGGASSQIGSMLASPNQLWTVAGGLAQPIFQGGALLHRQRAAQAALDVAEAQHRGAILAGFQNVADVLAAIQTDAEAFRDQQAAETAAQRSADAATLRHRMGDVSGLEELTARAALLQVSLARTQAEGARLSDSVALYVALGGGWSERERTALAAGGDLSSEVSR